MTPKEFLDAVEPLLDHRTFEPFVLEMVDGTVVHIDHPREIEVGMPFRLVKRREAGKTVVLDPKRVVRVVPLERMEPAGVGIHFPQFRDTLRHLLRAEPFAPFDIELRSGSKLRVDAPNRLAMSGRFATVIRPQMAFETFSNADVIRITPEVASADA